MGTMLVVLAAVTGQVVGLALAAMTLNLVLRAVGSRVAARRG